MQMILLAPDKRSHASKKADRDSSFIDTISFFL